jgi:hypothetical protein
MADRLFLVKLKVPQGAIHRVVAQTAEIQGEHLVLLKAEGKLAALFMLDVVESWNEL